MSVPSCESAAPFDTKRVIAKWMAFAEEVLPVRCEESWQSFSSVQGQAMPRFSKWDCKFAFDQGGRSSFFHCEHYPANGPDEVEQYGWIDNRDYRAQLTKRGQNKSWQLSELILGTDTAIHKKMGYRMACPWLRCGNIWLPEWIADASFVVTRTEEVLEAGAAKALRVHFAYDASQRQSQADDVPDYVQSGFIDFDPLCRWRVMRYEYYRKNSDAEGFERGRFEYDPASDNPVARSLLIERPETKSRRFGAIRSREEWVFGIEFRACISDEEFRLSYYGLPEPAALKAKTHQTSFWYFAAGLVALLLGFCFLALR